MKQTVKLSELPKSETLEGFSAVGVSSENQTVKVDMSHIQHATDGATEAITAAGNAASTASTAATKAMEATSKATEATKGVADAIDKAELVAKNPTKIGADNYVYTYDLATKKYIKTDIYVKGDPGVPVVQIVGGSTTSVMSQKAVTDEIGKRAMPMDYSTLAEQVVPGEYWTGRGGVRAQLYSKTIVLILPVTLIAAENKGLFTSPILTGVDKIFSASGTYSIDTGSEQSALINWKDFIWCVDVLKDTGKATISGRTPVGDVGKNINIALSIKYTKI